MVEELDYPLEKRNRPELVQRQKLFVDECKHIENLLEAVGQEAL